MKLHEGGALRDVESAACSRRSLRVRTCGTLVSCQFSDFHMSQLDFHVRVQCVGVLSAGDCLSHDPITKAQRQSGRQVWQAAVPVRARQCVWEQTGASAFSVKSTRMNEHKKCPITSDRRGVIIV